MIEVPEVEDVIVGRSHVGGIGVGLYRDEQDAFEYVWKPGTTFWPTCSVTAKYAASFSRFTDNSIARWRRSTTSCTTDSWVSACPMSRVPAQT